MHRLLGLLIAASTLASATTYYVATTGSDSAAGTIGAPFLTVTKGVASAVNPGDVVMVENGTYTNNGQVQPNAVVTLAHSGTSGNNIVIQAQNRGMAILDSGNTSTTTTCNGAYAYFNLNSQSFVTIQGFVIQHACHNGFWSNGTEHDFLIKWNTIQNIANHEDDTQVGDDGIYQNSNEYNFTFDGNIFHNIGRTSGQTQLHFDHGIYTAATNVKIINNIFEDCPSGFAIQLPAGASTILIANNVFNGACTNDGEAGQIIFWSTNSNITLNNNIFNNPNGSALTSYVPSVTNSTFDYNIVHGVSSVGAPSGVTVGSHNQLGVDPLFVNPESYNFTLQSGSPAIGAGLTIAAVTDDFNGNPRTAPYTEGAYQYGAPVCTITTASLPGGTVGVAYSQTVATSGCASPTFTISVGSLPTSLAIGSSTGVISGTPTVAATSNFTVAVSDANGSPTKALSIVIAPAPVSTIGVSINGIPYQLINLGSPSTGHASCWNGTTISYCTTAIASDGTCTCH